MEAAVEEETPAENDAEPNPWGGDGTAQEAPLLEPVAPDPVEQVAPEPIAVVPPEEPAPAPKPTSTTGTFTSQPPGAEIRLNGESMGVTPWKATLANDTYAVAMVLDGHKTQNREITIEPSTPEVSMTLEPTALVTLYVEAPGRKGDTLFINSRPVGSVPRAVELKPGQYTFTLEGPGGERLTLTRDVAVGGDPLLKMK